jgi:hypothetical protein
LTVNNRYLNEEGEEGREEEDERGEEGTGLPLLPLARHGGGARREHRGRA